MKSSTRHFAIGLFLLVGFGLFALACILFGGSQLFAKKLTFETYFASSVQGLDVGGPVKFRGMKIGKIEEIGFAGSHYGERPEIDLSAPGIHRALSYIRVVCSIDLKAHPHFGPDRIQAMLKRGLRANLEMQGITGTVFINLDFFRDGALAAEAKPLSVPWTPDELYVPSAPNTLQSFLSVAEKIAAKLEDLDFSRTVDALTSLVQSADSAIVRADLPKLTATFTSLGQSLSAELEKLDALIVAIDGPALSKDLHAFSSQLAELSTELRAALPGLVSSADKTLAQVNTTLADVSPLLTEVTNSVRTLRETLSPEVGEDLAQTLSALARTSAVLEALISELRERPSRLIFDDKE
ncbi:MAG: MlaD family protein [Lentisphaeraceae bacterium]|nr:MlaD family protein [Lentisphaeraceae bacterium]